MSCTSCYNGCVDVTPDECVRYTGLSIPALGITTGDTLKYVELMITNKLVPLLTGTGDVITIAPADTCTLITQFLIGITNPNSKQLFTALTKAACNLQVQVTAVKGSIDALNADYVISCLTGVTASSDTHEIVQAIITKLCATVTALAALSIDVSTNYVKISDIDAIIAAYLASHGGGTTQYSTYMIPYTAVEYYGDITVNFDGTGAGLSSKGLSRIFLCNGLNGTPDKRGRVGVGAIKNVPGGPLDGAVNPTASPFNPNYVLYAVGGANSVVLNTTQIPAHTHGSTGTTTVTMDEHFHFAASSTEGVTVLVDSTHVMGRNAGWGNTNSYQLSNSSGAANVGKTSLAKSNITSNTPNNVTIVGQSAGGGQAHSNTQPVLACYYIMYIPL